MADKKPTAPKPPAPPPKPASAVSEEAKRIEPKKAGVDVGRPFRYLNGFIKGTVKHTLDNCSNLGRKCSKIGAVVGLLLAFSGIGFGIEMVAMGWMAGLATGAVVGAATGIIGGGIRGMDREQRKEKYADDLLQKAKAKSAPQPKVDYREAHREHKRRDNYMWDRQTQQLRENEADTKRYFQDQVSHSRSHGHGWGQGF